MTNTCCKLQLLERLSNPHAVAHSCATGDSYCLPLLLGTGRIQGLECGFHPLRRAAQVGGGAEVSGDAGPKAAESTSQLAARAGSSATFLLLQTVSESISGGLCLAICHPRTVSSPSLPSGLGQGNHRHIVHGDGHFLGSQGWDQGGLNSLHAADSLLLLHITGIIRALQMQPDFDQNDPKL